MSRSLLALLSLLGLVQRLAGELDGLFSSLEIRLGNLGAGEQFLEILVPRIQVEHAVAVENERGAVIGVTARLDVDIVAVAVEADRHLLALAVGLLNAIEDGLGELLGVLLENVKRV